MGLDWVVLDREIDGTQVNPTEVLGAKRATRIDPEVLNEMRRIWETGDREVPFEEFVEGLVSRETPPIVISYGEGFEAAIPAVKAEAQYYGYRAKAIEPDVNRISAFAVANGISMDWLYDEMCSPAEILQKIQILEKVFDRYRVANSPAVQLAEKYDEEWKRRGKKSRVPMSEFSGGDAAMEEHLYEIHAFLGAIEWLRFWSDKGFEIVADY
ncbi:MAG TPA: hypothetical protein VGS22_08700 [Thermoanaerobaculia bacterium]|jgi:hypothetical protein|nr:hypothetical protein [Thermoanaerobaculia bacterium]